MNEMIALCQIDDLPERESKGFLKGREGQDALFIVKVEGELYGWRNACPHVGGAPMAWKKDEYMSSNKMYLTCFAHGALFEPETGLCIQGPCLGKKLDRVDVYVDEQGTVFTSGLDNKNKES